MKNCKYIANSIYNLDINVCLSSAPPTPAFDHYPMTESGPSSSTSYETLLLLKYLASASDNIFTKYGYYTNILVYVMSIRGKCQLESSKIYQLCGTIAFKYHSEIWIKVWKIYLVSGYNIYLFFNAINLIYSRYCEMDYLHIVKNEGSEEIYCGYLSPWNETYPCQIVKINVEMLWSKVPRAGINISYMVSRKKGISRQMSIESHNAEYTSYIRGKTGHRWPFYDMIVHIVARSRLDLVMLRRQEQGGNSCEYKSKCSNLYFFHSFSLIAVPVSMHLELS